MLARPDSSAPSGLSTASAAPFPAWARARHPPETEAEAAFLAGAALARLDAVVRENPPWAGASVRRPGAARTRRRCATRSPRPAGRRPGPAGRRLLAWRALAAGSAGQWGHRRIFPKSYAKDLRRAQTRGLSSNGTENRHGVCPPAYDGNGRIAGLQGSRRERPEFGRNPSFHCQAE
jgi:Protein of unknown function (DUF1403)